MAKLSLPELKSIVSTYVTENKVSNATFSVTRDNIVGLVDKIGKIVTLDTVFTNDKLAFLDGEYLSYGKTIEEWQQDLILPVDKPADGAGALSPHLPTYRPSFYSYTIGEKVIETTILNNNIERAVHFEAELVSIVAMQTKRLQDSMAVYRYGLKREMIGCLINLCAMEMGTGGINATTGKYGASETSPVVLFAKGTSYVVNSLVKNASTATAYGIIVKAYTANDATDWTDAVAKGYIIVLDLEKVIDLPTDTSKGEAFIKQVKADIELASDISEGHSLNGNTLGAVEGLVLLVKQGVIPSLEVDTYAGAFNREDLAVPARIVVVKDFGSASSNVFAVLMDNRGARLHNTYRAMRDNTNGRGDFLNLFDHTEDTAFISRNTFVKVYKSA